MDTQHKVAKKILNILKAFISTLSIALLSRELFCTKGELLEIVNCIIGEASYEDFAIFCFLVYFYNCNLQQKAKNISIILSMGFSFCLVIGKSYWELGTWDIIAQNPGRLIGIIAFLGVFPLLYRLLSGLFALIEEKGSLLMRTNQGNKNISRVKLWLFIWIILIVCWSPYIIINLPGSVPYDGYRQINMALGLQTLTNHHPYVITLLYGSIFSLGQIINDNLGVFLIILFNCLIFSLACSYAVVKIYEWGFKLWICFITTVFFGILPMWGGYVQAVIKDIIFCAIFLIYFIKFSDILLKIINKKRLCRREWIEYTILAICVCWARNNGAYIVVPVTIAVLILSLKFDKRSIVILMFLVAANIGFSTIVLPAADVKKGSIKEVLSIPFQQVARYVKYYGEELEEAEAMAIDKVLDLRTIADKYNPDKSDPVKDTMRKDVGVLELKEFAATWLSLLRKHPGVYLQATINNTYGYFYPAYRCKVLLSYNYYIEEKKAANTGELDIKYLKPDSRLRKGLSLYSDFWQIAPGISMLSSPGFYTWVNILLAAALLVQRKSKYLVIMLVPLLHIAICIASPVNGLLRYAMPLIAITPVLAAWVIYVISSSENITTEN